jgi:hypothetical protein
LKQKLIKGEERKQSRTDNIDKYEEVINVLQAYLNEHHSHRKINTQKTLHKTKPVWWMMECNKIMAEQKRAHRRYIQNISAETRKCKVLEIGCFHPQVGEGRHLF